MTSYRQIEANRRNALRSTGPKMEAGKQVSRRSAVRRGFTAETVIGVPLDRRKPQERNRHLRTNNQYERLICDED